MLGHALFLVSVPAEMRPETSYLDLERTTTHELQKVVTFSAMWNVMQYVILSLPLQWCCLFSQVFRLLSTSALECF